MSTPMVGESSGAFPALPNKTGVASFVELPLPGVTRVTAGAAASTVHVNAAGVPSTLPAPSIARTSNRWLPSERPEYVFGLVQSLKPAASSWHWNRADDSLVKTKVADADELGSGG